MARETEDPWRRVDEHDPPWGIVETRREGEEGTNLCYRASPPGTPAGEIEWIELSTGRTTVTHTTFAAPTHWRVR